MLCHPNVLPLLGVIENQPTMVSEWMGNGDIKEYVKAHPNVNRLELVRFSSNSLSPFAPTFTQSMQLAGVTRGLMYIHDQGIVHGNLKGVRTCIPGSLLR